MELEGKLRTLRLSGKGRPLGARARPPLTPSPAASKQRRRPRHGENKWRREYLPTASATPTSKTSRGHPDTLLEDLMSGSRERTPTPIALPFPPIPPSRQQHRGPSKLATVSRFPTPPTYNFISSPSPDSAHLPTITVTNTDLPFSQASPTPSVIYTPDMEINTPLCLSLPVLLDAERRLPKLCHISSQDRQARWSGRNHTSVKLPALGFTCSASHQRSRSFSDGSLEKLPALQRHQ